MKFTGKSIANAGAFNFVCSCPWLWGGDSLTALTGNSYGSPPAYDCLSDHGFASDSILFFFNWIFSKAGKAMSIHERIAPFLWPAEFFSILHFYESMFLAKVTIPIKSHNCIFLICFLWSIFLNLLVILSFSKTSGMNQWSFADPCSLHADKGSVPELERYLPLVRRFETYWGL